MYRTLVCKLPFLLLLTTLAPACGDSASSQSTSSVQSDSESSQSSSQRSCETRKLQCEVAASALQARLNHVDPTSARFELLMQQIIDKQIECGQIASRCGF
jgi:hypothetical protein